MPVVLALLSSAFWGASDFLGGTLTRRLPVLVVLGISQLVGGVAMLVAAVVLGELSAPLDYLPWAVAAGLIGALSLAAFYLALARGTMGVVAPIAALGAIVPVVVSVARGERPTLWQIVGIAVAVFGVFLASGPELSGASGPRPLVLASLAAVGFGMTLLFVSEGSKTSTVMTVAAMRASTVPLIALVLFTVLRRAAQRPASGDLWLIALVGLGDVAANLTFGFASTRELVSVVVVLASLYPVFTVLLARWIHGERLARIQNLGIAFAFAGVVLITAPCGWFPDVMGACT